MPSARRKHGNPGTWRRSFAIAAKAIENRCHFRPTIPDSNSNAIGSGHHPKLGNGKIEDVFILADAGRAQESLDLAKQCIDSAQIDDRKLRAKVISTAIKAAMILLPENRQELLNLIPELPREIVVRLADETGKKPEIEELINELDELRVEGIPF